MKKSIATVALGLAVMMLALLAGCSSQPQVKDVPVEEIAAKVIPEELKNTMMESDEAIVSEATGLDLSLIEEGEYYDPMMNVRVFTCYIAKVKNASDVETVKAGFEKRLKAQQDAFAQYLPDQYELALKGQVVSQGNYVMLAILEDTPAAVSAFQDMLK